ncbi:hypothetical protein P8452_05785 [Trifolium repens]|nr:hypothetical protein P8452_05785 [Trifolium repens]
MRIEEGNEDEKLLWSNKSDFRFTNGERSGIRPNSELLLRFTTLSSTSCDKLFDGNIPWRGSYRTTFLFSHVTPFQLQKPIIDFCVCYFCPLLVQRTIKLKIHEGLWSFERKLMSISRKTSRGEPWSVEIE